MEFVSSTPQDKAFAAFVGLVRPHTPTVVPREYFDLYPLEEISVPDYPDGAVDALSDFARQFHDGKFNNVDFAEAIQSYLASISFADAQLGRLLDLLDDANLWNKTTFVLWSDHGYHAGTHDKVGKFTLWEESANAPLIVVDPDQDRAGVEISTPVSFAQIFATVADLTGMAVPQSVSQPSFASLVRSDLGTYSEAPVLTYIYGSLSMRAGDYRLIRYEDGFLEFYDLARDHDQKNNLAADGQNADLVDEYLALMQAAGRAEGIVFGDDLDVLNGGRGDDRLIATSSVSQVAGRACDDDDFVENLDAVLERPDNGFDTVFMRSDGNVARAAPTPSSAARGPISSSRGWATSP